MPKGSKWQPRYIKNPFVNSPSDASQQVSSEWLKHHASKLIAEILKYNITMDDCQSGAYTGACGIAYALLRATRHFPERRAEFLEQCQRLNSQNLKIIKKDDGRPREYRFLLGTTSVYIISILCDQGNEYFMKRLNEISKIVSQNDYQGDGDDEMLAGRAGFLAAVLNLREAGKGEIIPLIQVKKVVKKMIDSGRLYSYTHNLEIPLMYQYHGREYLGSAHGLMGIIQMLLSFQEFLDDDEKKDVVETLDWLVSIQLYNGNIPTKTSDLNVDHGENELVHWCHGAAGFIHLMIVAYIVLKQTKYLSAAEKALNLIWHKGFLTKGPGICHGVAGSGYAFLLYYRLTKNEKWLDRAKCFAAVMLSENFKSKSRTPDRPYSLFEGIAGSLCFLCDLLDPENVQFPLIPICF